eukprot:514114_1
MRPKKSTLSLNVDSKSYHSINEKASSKSDGTCSCCLKYICCCWFWNFCCVCRWQNCKDIFGWLLLVSFYGSDGYIWYYAIQNGKPTHLLQYTLENINNALKPYTGGDINQFYNTFSKQIQSLFATLYQVYPVLIIVIIISMVVTQVYVYLLSKKRIRCCIYKLAVIKSFLFGAGACYLLYVQVTKVHGDLIKIGQYIFAVFLGLYTIIMSAYGIYWNKNYKQNAQLIENALTEAAKPINKYKWIAFIPILLIVLIIIWSVLNVYLLLCVYTSSSSKPIGTYTQVVYQAVNDYQFYLSIIIGIWITNTIYIFGCLTIARIICIVNGWNYNTDAKQVKTWIFCYAVRDIFNNHLGTVSFCALFMLWEPYIRFVVHVFGKIKSCSSICIDFGSNKCCKNGKCAINCCNTCLRCVCGKCCVFMFDGIVFILNKCCLCSCWCTETISKGMYKLLNYIFCIGIVGVENLSVIGLKNYFMFRSYYIVLPYLNTDANNDSHLLEVKEKAQANKVLDKKVDWVLWVSQIWIPLFTCFLALLFIEHFPIGIQGEVNSLLLSGGTSFVAGFIIGNLYMSIYRYSAHLAQFHSMLDTHQSYQ